MSTGGIETVAAVVSVSKLRVIPENIAGSAGTPKQKTGLPVKEHALCPTRVSEF